MFLCTGVSYSTLFMLAGLQDAYSVIAKGAGSNLFVLLLGGEKWNALIFYNPFYHLSG